MHPRTPNETDLYVGKRIRQFREERGLTLQGISEQLDVSYQQIQKYESGHNRISAGTLFELSKILQMPVQMFFPWTE